MRICRSSGFSYKHHHCDEKRHRGYTRFNSTMLPESHVSVRLTNCNYEDDYLAYKRFRLRVCACSFLSLVVIVLFASSMIVQIANHSLFYPRTFESGQGDQRLAPVSTLFCQGILLGRDDVARRLLIVPSPKLRPSRQRSNVSSEVLVSKFKYWYKTLYLLKGSSVLIEANADSTMRLFIFNGRVRLDEWLKRHKEKGLPLDDKGDDSENKKEAPARSTEISYELSVQDTNNYYILFSYSEGRKALARLSLTLTVKRKVYDLQNYVDSCEASAGESCAGRLKFNSAEKAIIEVLGSSITNDVVNSITTWKCEPRIWLHVAVFGGAFLVFLVAVILIYVFTLKGKKRKLVLKLQRMRENHERQSLLSRSGTFRSSIRSNVNGSIRRPISRTPSRSSSLRSCSNQPQTRLPPVVTPMYTGLLGSEDSGHETDDESKTRPCVAMQRRLSAASTSSFELVRKPSFSTFQGSDIGSDGLNLPRGRSHSAPHENGFRASRTLPRGRTDSCASEPSGRTSFIFPTAARPASLPTLPPPPTQRLLLTEQANPELKTSHMKVGDEFKPEEPHGSSPKTNIKFRSLPSRRREMSWKPRLSMVSEV